MANWQKMLFGLKIIFYVYLFLLSIKFIAVFSDSLAGQWLTDALANTESMTVGLLLGILCTSIIQSSSVVTAITIGLVGGGVLPMPNAIGIVLGANMGTSVTDCLVSFGYFTQKKRFERAFGYSILNDVFNVLSLMVLFPIEYYWHPIEKLATKTAGIIPRIGFEWPGIFNSLTDPIVGMIGQTIPWPSVFLVLAFIGILFSLRGIANMLQPIIRAEMSEGLNKKLIKNPAATFLVGMAVTILLQSSSVAGAILIPFVASGLFETLAVFPYILGTNLGTTFKAILAAMIVGGQPALIIALLHLYYNAIRISLLVLIGYDIPVVIAEKIASFQIRNKWFAPVYLAGLFFILPALGVLLLTK